MKKRLQSIAASIIKEYTTFLKKYFCIKGRAGRHQFWSVFIATFILSFLFSFIPQGLIAFALITLIPTLTLYIRRFHDFNCGRKTILVSFLPLIISFIATPYSIYAFLFAIFYTQILLLAGMSIKGSPKANNYGLAPRYNDNKYQKLYIATALLSFCYIIYLIGNTIWTIEQAKKILQTNANYGLIMDSQILTPIFKNYPQSNFPQDMQHALSQNAPDALKHFIKNGNITIRGQEQTFTIIFNGLNAKLCRLTQNYQGRYRLVSEIAHSEALTEEILNGSDFSNGCTCESNTCSVALSFSR